MEERFIDLEIRLAHQEAMIQDLNDVIVRQQKDIDFLTLTLSRLREQVQAQADNMQSSPQDEAPPPHY